MPASATTMSLPLPSMKAGTPASRASAEHRRPARRPCVGAAKRSAGPPTRSVVSGASGASACERDAALGGERDRGAPAPAARRSARHHAASAPGRGGPSAMASSSSARARAASGRPEPPRGLGHRRAPVVVEQGARLGHAAGRRRAPRRARRPPRPGRRGSRRCSAGARRRTDTARGSRRRRPPPAPRRSTSRRGPSTRSAATSASAMRSVRNGSAVYRARSASGSAWRAAPASAMPRSPARCRTCQSASSRGSAAITAAFRRVTACEPPKTSSSRSSATERRRRGARPRGRCRRRIESACPTRSCCRGMPRASAGS